MFTHVSGVMPDASSTPKGWAVPALMAPNVLSVDCHDLGVFL
jgi:hypothetical protein